MTQWKDHILHCGFVMIVDKGTRPKEVLMEFYDTIGQVISNIFKVKSPPSIEYGVAVMKSLMAFSAAFDGESAFAFNVFLEAAQHFENSGYGETEALVMRGLGEWSLLREAREPILKIAFDYADEGDIKALRHHLNYILNFDFDSAKRDKFAQFSIKAAAQAALVCLDWCEEKDRNE